MTKSGHRGYAAVGLVNPKNACNVGSVLRAAYCYDVRLVLLTGGRAAVRSCADTPKAYRHIPTLRVNDLHEAVPYDCVPVAVELVPGRAISLTKYVHPERALYVFGQEDGTLGEKVLSWCRDVVYIPTRTCMNLAACVNVVLYDRMVKNDV